jgi:hypothetical protein
VAGLRLDAVLVYFFTQQLEKQGVVKGRTGFLTAAIKTGGVVRKELMFVALFHTPCLLLNVKCDVKFSVVLVHPEDPASGKDCDAANIWSMYCWERQVLVLSVRWWDRASDYDFSQLLSPSATQVRASVGIHNTIRPSNHRPLYLF